MYSTYILGVCDDDDDDDGDDDVLVKHRAMLRGYISGIELLAVTYVHMYVHTSFVWILPRDSVSTSPTSHGKP